MSESTPTADLQLLFIPILILAIFPLPFVIVGITVLTLLHAHPRPLRLLFRVVSAVNICAAAAVCGEGSGGAIARGRGFWTAVIWMWHLVLFEEDGEHEQRRKETFRDKEETMATTNIDGEDRYSVTKMRAEKGFAPALYHQSLVFKRPNVDPGGVGIGYSGLPAFPSTRKAGHSENSNHFPVLPRRRYQIGDNSHFERARIGGDLAREKVDTRRMSRNTYCGYPSTLRDLSEEVHGKVGADMPAGYETANPESSTSSLLSENEGSVPYEDFTDLMNEHILGRDPSSRPKNVFDPRWRDRSAPVADFQHQGAGIGKYWQRRASRAGKRRLARS